MKLGSPLSKKLLAALLVSALALAVIASTGIGTAAGATNGVSASEAFESVNPWIGTGFNTHQNKGNSAYGNTWPGAAMPFGMTQFTPTTHGTRSGSNDAGGYESGTEELRGFGMTRLSGTGCEERNSAFDIPLLPYTGALAGNGAPATSPGSNINAYYLHYKHENEESQPGYYKVALDNGVEAQLGATLRTTVGQFTYPTGKESSTLLVNASGSNNDSGETQVTIDPTARTISGFTTSQTVCGEGTYRIYFSSQYDKPFEGFGTWNAGTLNASAETVTSTAGKNQAGAYVTFAPGTTVTVRTGISYVSVEGAEENRLAEAPESKPFATVRQEARQAWEKDLGTISIATSDEEEKEIFYTALYHALLQPNVYDDVDGKYREFGTGTTLNPTVKELAPGQEHEYVTYSGWDQYRGQSQLIALLFPKVGDDIAQSITDLATQTGHWYNWPHLGSGQDKQQGDALQTMVASYAAFGDTGFNETAALDSMLSTQSLPGVGSTRSNLLSDIAVGWIEDRNNIATSTTLDYAMADFDIAQFAKELHEETEAQAFMTRAQHWEDLVSSNVHQIVPRDRMGYWSGFDLTHRNFELNKPNGGAANEQFDQSTGDQYQWSVPWDVTRLIKELGGKAAATTKLNKLMVNLDESGVTGSGNYLSNEPAFITPWIYSWLEEPDMTTATIDRVRHELFNNTAEGLAGNDDLGALSSYYVWSSIGLYPAIFGRAELLEAAPAFESVTIEPVGSTHKITISAPEATTKRDVASTKVNGATSMKSWLPASFAQQGGTLEYTLGETASDWGVGAENVPPSYDEGSEGFNGIATTKDGEVSAGSLDFSGNSLSVEKLAEKGLVAGHPVTVPGAAFEGIRYSWPTKTAGGFDSWVPHGQAVPMGDVRASKISFLGLATNGPSEATAKVVYSDGSSVLVPVDFTDWTTGAPNDGNVVVAGTSGRNTSGGTADGTEARVFATAPAALDPTKRVEKVILPETVESGIEHIFDVATNSLATPSVIFGDGTIAAGGSISVTGSGFVAGETVDLTLTSDGGTSVATGTATADGSGGLSTSFKVPGATPTGAYELTVDGLQSADPASTAVTVTGFSPAITATASVTTGGPVTVNGSGYAPGESVALSLGGATSTVTAGATGTWSATLTAPSAAGSYEVVAIGAVSEVKRAQTVTVTAAPPTNTGTSQSSGGSSQSSGNGSPAPTTPAPNPTPTPTKPKAPTKVKTKTTLKVSEKRLAGGEKEVVTVTVSPSSAAGRVALMDGSRTLKTLTLKKGKAEVTLALAAGTQKLSARFLGSADAAASKSATVDVKVARRAR
jgi:predicted alpha-1,2-mannosidase